MNHNVTGTAYIYLKNNTVAILLMKPNRIKRELGALEGPCSSPKAACSSRQPEGEADVFSSALPAPTLLKIDLCIELSH